MRGPLQPMIAGDDDQLARTVIGQDQPFDQFVGVARIGREVNAEPAMVDDPRQSLRRFARVEDGGCMAQLLGGE